MGLCGEACGLVGGEDFREGGGVGGGVGFHDVGDGLPDVGELDGARAEGIDGDFVGGVEDGGEGAAGKAGLTGELEGGEGVVAG